MELMMELLPLAIQAAMLAIQGIIWVIDFWIEHNDRIIQTLKDIWTWIKDNVVPVIRDQLWPLIRDELIPALSDLQDEFKDLWDEIVNLWEELEELARVITEDLLPDLDLGRLAMIAVYGAVFLLRYWIILLTGTIRILTEIIKPMVKQWKTAAAGAKSLRESIQLLRSKGIDLLGTIKSIIDRGLRVVNTFYDMRDAARNLADAIFDIPSLPSGLSGGLFNFFADGGIVNRATAAIIGEA